jgi:hypothetical protein
LREQPGAGLLQTDLHEKHENLNKNLNLPALSQLQFGHLSPAHLYRSALNSILPALDLVTTLRGPQGCSAARLDAFPQELTISRGV